MRLILLPRALAPSAWLVALPTLLAFAGCAGSASSTSSGTPADGGALAAAGTWSGGAPVTAGAASGGSVNTASAGAGASSSGSAGSDAVSSAGGASGSAGAASSSAGAASSSAGSGGTAAASNGGASNAGSGGVAGSGPVIAPKRDASSKVPVSRAPSGYTAETNFAYGPLTAQR